MVTYGRGRAGALLHKARPGTGHTGVARSWMGKAIYIWDEESIGVLVPPTTSQEKHLMLREAAVWLAKWSLGLCPRKGKCKCRKVSGDSLGVRLFHFM